MIIHKAKTSNASTMINTLCGKKVKYEQASVKWNNVTCEACLSRRGVM